MNKLKRSEKFCPSCKCKNPIRTFNCKQCSYAFPQKDNPNKKPKKEKSKKQNECFLDIKGEKTSSENKISFFKKVETFEQSDVINKKILSKYIEENLKFRKNPEFKEIIDASNVSEHFDLLMNENEVEIKLKDQNLCENYHYDFTRLYSNSNLIGSIAHFSIKLNKFVLSVFQFSDFSHDIGINPNNLINFYPLKLVSSHCIIIENDEYEINRYSLKFLNSTPILLLARNNFLRIFLYNNDTGINLLYKIDFKEFINSFDCIISCDNQIKIVTSDYNNTIFLHIIPLTDEKINKFSTFEPILSLIYEKQFSNKITHLKFLPFSEEISPNNEKNFFCCSSREGLTKFFDTINPLSYSFRHKTSELWVSTFSYDKLNNILYYMTNVGEKIHGIKFFTDELKDPLVKKIPNTENSIYFLKDTITDRLYFQNKNGKISYIDSVNINEMFVNYKKKIKYNIKVYDFYENKIQSKEDKLEIETENDDKSDSCKSNSKINSKPGSETDSVKTIDLCGEENSADPNSDGIFTKFSIVAIPHKETKEIKNFLILPCLEKIIIKILSKK